MDQMCIRDRVDAVAAVALEGVLGQGGFDQIEDFQQAGTDDFIQNIAFDGGILHSPFSAHAHHFIGLSGKAVGVPLRLFEQFRLRQLAPAKLEGRGKGELVSLVTSDIELLEVDVYKRQS